MSYPLVAKKRTNPESRAVASFAPQWQPAQLAVAPSDFLLKMRGRLSFGHHGAPFKDIDERN
jgi:hypothetical protein